MKDNDALSLAPAVSVLQHDQSGTPSHLARPLDRRCTDRPQPVPPV